MAQKKTFIATSGILWLHGLQHMHTRTSPRTTQTWLLPAKTNFIPITNSGKKAETTAGIILEINACTSKKVPYESTNKDGKW